MKFLVPYGEGGCWNGYPESCIIESVSLEMAEKEALELLRQKYDRGDGKTIDRGFSYDVIPIETTVQELAVYKCRLLPLAKMMADQHSNALISRRPNLRLA